MLLSEYNTHWLFERKNLLDFDGSGLLAERRKTQQCLALHLWIFSFHPFWLSNENLRDSTLHYFDHVNRNPFVFWPGQPFGSAPVKICLAVVAADWLWTEKGFPATFFDQVELWNPVQTYSPATNVDKLRAADSKIWHPGHSILQPNQRGQKASRPLIVLIMAKNWPAPKKGWYRCVKGDPSVFWPGQQFGWLAAIWEKFSS